MSEDDKKQRALSRAAQASALLNNEILNESLAELETGYTSALFLTHINDTNARERLYQAVQVVRKVKDHLNAVVANGKIVQKEIEQITDPERKKLFGII